MDYPQYTFAQWMKIRGIGTMKLSAKTGISPFTIRRYRAKPSAMKSIESNTLQHFIRALRVPKKAFSTDDSKSKNGWFQHEMRSRFNAPFVDNGVAKVKDYPKRTTLVSTRFTVPDYVLKASHDFTPTDKLVLGLIVSNIEQETEWKTTETQMARTIGCDASSINRSLFMLEKAGLIEAGPDTTAKPYFKKVRKIHVHAKWPLAVVTKRGFKNNGNPPANNLIKTVDAY